MALLNAKEGSRSGCLLTLSGNMEAIAFESYFKNVNIDGFKQYLYLCAKQRIMRQHIFPGEGYLVTDLFTVLVSDNAELIEWYRQCNSMFYPDKAISDGDKDNPKNWMFYRYQSWLALNSRWDELGERCERVLAIKDEIKKDRSYLIDHRFYLALAKGDKAGMENVLEEKSLPKNRRIRYEQESGITRDFIDSYATFFAKLAWYNGYEVEVENPWIPKDWLPIKPNDQYDDVWEFMKEFDIWQPFAEPWTKFSPRLR
ncbi:Imm49 family immunity protein [Comamonas sp. MYb396]|uniref:Imm49 family immunity protein n=1 Tax=Comamonas sp. MYb396 TaxID=2745302 RepID=UPI0030D6CF0E